MIACGVKFGDSGAGTSAIACYSRRLASASITTSPRPCNAATTFISAGTHIQYAAPSTYCATDTNCFQYRSVAWLNEASCQLHTPQ